MHERSLVRNLLNQINNVMRQQHAERVVAVRVSVGEFAGVDAELLRLAFEEMTGGTAMSDAKLLLDRKSLEARCDECCHEFVVERFRFRCTACGSGRITIQRGEELLLESVTLEQAV